MDKTNKNEIFPLSFKAYTYEMGINPAYYKINGGIVLYKNDNLHVDHLNNTKCKTISKENIYKNALNIENSEASIHIINDTEINNKPDPFVFTKVIDSRNVVTEDILRCQREKVKLSIPFPSNLPRIREENFKCIKFSNIIDSESKRSIVPFTGNLKPPVIENNFKIKQLYNTDTREKFYTEENNKSLRWHNIFSKFKLGNENSDVERVIIKRIITSNYSKYFYCNYNNTKCEVYNFEKYNKYRTLCSTQVIALQNVLHKNFSNGKSTVLVYEYDKTEKEKQSVFKSFSVNVNNKRPITADRTGGDISIIIQKNEFFDIELLDNCMISALPLGLEFSDKHIKGTLANSGEYNITAMYSDGTKQNIKITIPFYRRIS